MSYSYVRSAIATIVAFVVLGVCQMIGGIESRAAAQAPGVTITEDDTNYVLENGTVTATVAKATGNLRSLKYKGTEVLFQQRGKEGALFSQNATGGTGIETKITIDPKTNGGERGEVSVKGIARRDVQSDIDFRFSVGRGDSGVYFYVYYDHKADYPAVSFPESRWVTRLDEMFNWTLLDENNMREVPADLNGHQYLYTAAYFEQRAYGWASASKNMGVWLINASTEYTAGGATKNDFLTHRDNPPADPFAPCILLFYRPSHFGGGGIAIGQGEKFTKVIGPMFLYCNTGPDPLTMWKEAKTQATKEMAKWPYAWVSGIDYPKASERGSVKGQVVLSDPMAPGAKMSHVLVGLAHPPYAPPGGGGRGGRGGRGRGGAPAAADAPAADAAPASGGRQTEWAGDAKYYQFWAHGQDDGNFSITNVIPGTYTLHAIADGVLGEFAKADITVEAGKSVDLGKLTWTPVRRGKQIWEIGVPNRNAREFTYGEKYWDPDGPLLYPKMFPNDVNFTIGKSDVAKDWFWEHVPHAIDDSGQRNGNAGVTGEGRATPYKINFNMPEAPKGKATLRVAICGTQGRQIDVNINDKDAGQIALGGADLVITRHGAQGTWYERDFEFDAAMLKQGANVLTLTIPAGPVNNGVVYDYLRLELE